MSRKHFEGHGNHWEVFGDIDWGNFLQTSLQNAKLVEESFSEIAKREVIFSALYPEDGDVKFCTKMKSSSKKKAVTVESFHPYFEGLENEVVIKRVYLWKNKIEGEVEGSVGKVDLSFFAPFFYSQFAKAKAGEKYCVSLAGLACYVENAVMEYDISEGAFYEMALANFLNENSDKTKEDFPSAKIYLDGLPVLWPTEYFAEYEFRGKIFEIEDTAFDKYKFKKAKVCVGRKGEPDEITEEEDNIYINLYISESIGKECNLEVGNDIQGIVWLTGVKK